jgi:hypothetical protein
VRGQRRGVEAFGSEPAFGPGKPERFARWNLDKTPMSNIKCKGTFMEEVLSRSLH